MGFWTSKSREGSERAGDGGTRWKQFGGCCRGGRDASEQTGGSLSLRGWLCRELLVDEVVVNLSSIVLLLASVSLHSNMSFLNKFKDTAKNVGTTATAFGTRVAAQAESGGQRALVSFKLENEVRTTVLAPARPAPPSFTPHSPKLSQASARREESPAPASDSFGGGAAPLFPLCSLHRHAGGPVGTSRMGKGEVGAT